MHERRTQKLNLIDDILPEPLGGGHRNPQPMFATLERYISDTLKDLKKIRIDSLLTRRYERLRRWGSFYESGAGKKVATRGKSKAAAAPKAKASSGNGNGRKENGENGSGGNGRGAASRGAGRKPRDEAAVPADK